MRNNTLRQQKIDKIKKDMADKYVILMFCILLLFVFFFLFYYKNTFMIYYLLGGAIMLGSLWLLYRNKVSLEKIVRGYLIIGPIYNFVVMLIFWNYSIVSFVWLLPIPIGAYIFFSYKEVIFYSLYAILTIIAVAFSANHMPHYLQIIIPAYKVRYADIFLFIANIIIAAHLLNYNSKIRKLEIIANNSGC